MIDLHTIATVFLAGVVDICRNGVRGNITRASRQANGAKDTGPVLALVLLAAAGVLVVSGAVSIGSDDGPTLNLDTAPLLELVEGVDR